MNTRLWSENLKGKVGIGKVKVFLCLTKYYAMVHHVVMYGGVEI